tara:strand:+ start:176 stop:379 length:204 start_codon:yes stop_codon:yes gene_type:complete
MFQLLSIYERISNSDTIIYPSELKEMLDKMKDEISLTTEERTLIDMSYSFYVLGFDNKTKGKHPISP